MVYFKENYNFSKVSEVVQHFPGGGVGEGGQHFPEGGGGPTFSKGV